MRKSTKLPVIDIKKYGGQQVAIFGGKIVASGINTSEVIEKARQQLPKVRIQDILLVSVPKSLMVVYRL
ncbi:MAG: DUF5678 domain-containing protein [bacterium]|nr:DUF5678 domain-containing protein [bacterium]